MVAIHANSQRVQSIDGGFKVCDFGVRQVRKLPSDPVEIADNRAKNLADTLIECTI